MKKMILDDAAAKSFFREFEKQEITRVWRSVGTAIFIELGNLSSTKKNHLKGEMSLSVEWSWRIEGKNSILGGSFSEDDEISKTLNLLKGRRIIFIEYFSRLKEILVHLEGEIWLASFATEQGNPQWKAKNKAGEWLFVRKGKYIVEKNT